MLISLSALMWLRGDQARPAQTVISWPALGLSSVDRVLILAPHPDDEVLGCGGIIQQAVAMGLPLRIVFLTYGDNNQWSFMLYRKRPELLPGQVEGMGLVRHDEALAAAKVLDVPADDLIFLGYPDFGTLSIWESHWGAASPFRSMLTRVTAVPYQNALHPGAPYKGEAILGDLTAVIRDFRPTKVFVSHPADQNPDHLALYLFAHVALWDLAPDVAPQVYPYLVHYPGWPSPRGYDATLPLEPPGRLLEEIAWQSAPLTAGQESLKLVGVQAHRTQYGASARYLLSFVRPNELFGDFPVVRLDEAAGDVDLPQPAGTPAAAPPEQLTEAERDRFVGVESRTVRLEGDKLVITIGLSRPLGHGVGASVYAFGYRSDRPFAEMPKLHVRFGEFDHAVYDQRVALPRDAVQMTRQARQITIRIPLSVLGDPQRVLTSARTYLGEVPLNTLSWRVLELAPGS